MRIISTINDLKNIVDGWDQDGDLTPEQIEAAAYEIRDRGEAAGLTWGEDWQEFLASISSSDVLTFAEAA